MRFEVKNLTFSYTKNVKLLYNISFSCESGEVLTIIGRNGVGKTTLLKNILGLIKPLSGEIRLDNTDLIKIGKVDLFKYMSFVPQQNTIYLEYTVFDAVLVGLSKNITAFNNPTKDDYLSVENMLKKMGIYDLKDRRLHEISGGELQLTLISRALISKPKILILDEPENALDINKQIFIMTLLKKLAKDEKLIVILNTHYIDHALNFSDKTLILGYEHYYFGNSNDVITSENLFDAFNISVDIMESKNGYKMITPNIGYKGENNL